MDSARRLYACLAATFLRPLAVAHAWATAENVNDLIRAHGFGGGRSRGCRFVGAERTGVNAFFAREDLAGDMLPRVELASGLAYATRIDWVGRQWIEVGAWRGH